MAMLPLNPATANEQIASDVIVYGPNKLWFDDEQINYTIDSLCKMNNYTVGDMQRQQVIKLVNEHQTAIAEV